MASQFHNISNEALADMIGECSHDIKARTKRLDDLKTEFKRRRKVRIAGEKFEVETSCYSTSSFDAKAARAALGDVLAPFERTTECERTNIRLIMQMAA